MFRSNCWVNKQRTREPGSSVGTVSDYELDGRGSIPDRDRGFFLSPLRPDRLWGPPSLLYNGCRGLSYPGGKARPERDADHSPPSSAEVKKEQELYLLSPKCASTLTAFDLFRSNPYDYIMAHSILGK
jgi:hypothetical protein